MSNVLIGNSSLPALATALARPATGRVAVLTDTTTARLCLPRLKRWLPADALLVTMSAGEAHKTLETCQHVWAALTAAQVGRDGVLVCLGGGVVTDLGGFCAATYLRGIRCAYVPTTLLGMVDAAIGGKNGVDFAHLKNQLGTFREPTDGVFIEPAFLDTLDPAELTSGFAEVVKHWLVADAEAFRAERRTGLAGTDWAELIPQAVAIKQRIVESDPLETGARRLLNFGHTVGHALESWLLRQQSPVAHGFCVAAGMLMESWLARERGALGVEDFDRIATFVVATFPKVGFSPLAAEEIATLALHDKKNAHGTIRCVLLTAIGKAEIDHPVRVGEVAAALRWYAVTVN